METREKSQYHRGSKTNSKSGFIIFWDIMCAFAEMDNQHEQLQRDGVIREISRKARICGKNGHKTFLDGCASLQKLNRLHSRSLHWSPTFKRAVLSSSPSAVGYLIDIVWKAHRLPQFVWKNWGCFSESENFSLNSQLACILPDHRLFCRSSK
jgi:hypothetical protein